MEWLKGLIQGLRAEIVLQEIVELMFQTSLVTSGFDLESPKEFASRIYSMISLVTADGDDEGYRGNGSQVIEPEVMESSSDPWKQ